MAATEPKVRLTPGGLIFTEKSQSLRASLTLENTSQHAVIYKLKTSAPRRYSVSPNSGVLWPGETRSIGVRCTVSNPQADQFQLEVRHPTREEEEQLRAQREPEHRNLVSQFFKNPSAHPKLQFLLANYLGPSADCPGVAVPKGAPGAPVQSGTTPAVRTPRAPAAVSAPEERPAREKLQVEVGRLLEQKAVLQTKTSLLSQGESAHAESVNTSKLPKTAPMSVPIFWAVVSLFFALLCGRLCFVLSSDAGLMDDSVLLPTTRDYVVYASTLLRSVGLDL